MHRVLIVGAGATGGVIAAELVRRWRMPLFITIWDKARGAGGRMSTSRSPNDKCCRADLGAQYYSTKLDKNGMVNRFYEELLAARLLRELKTACLEKIPGFRVSDDSSYFACTEGTSVVVKHFLNEACAKCGSNGAVKIIYSKKLKRLSAERTGQTDAMMWTAEAEDGEVSVFDSVITTMPVPQALELVQNTSGAELATDVISELAGVKYSSRYAIALFFRRDTPDSVKSFPLLKFYKHDPIIRYASSCNAMRDDNASAAALIFHSTTEVGADDVHVDKVKAEKRIMEHLRTTVEPGLLYDCVDSIKFHRWLYSQVVQPYAGKPGFAVLCEKPLLMCAGDGFTTSNFDGCLESAVKTAEFFFTQTRA